MTGSWDLLGPALRAGLAGFSARRAGAELPAPVLALRPEQAALTGAASYAAAAAATARREAR